MRILLVNPPHTAIGSRIPKEHLPPLGLLAIGGPLIDAGHRCELLDADRVDMPVPDIVRHVSSARPDVVMIGHSGSTSAHPSAARIAQAIRAAGCRAPIVYGGVFPTYHWQDILEQEPAIDVIVRGEGEETVVRLVEAIEQHQPLSSTPGLAYREAGRPVATPPAPVIRDLDAHRIGWELIDPRLYSYWGDRRAVVVQFSRGCPRSCSYCGQRGFWQCWRHRDPARFAAEIAWLHRTHNIEVFNFADENPTANRKAWLTFCEALIAENVNVTLVGSTRADDVVRDADVLHVHKQAGVARWLLGVESADAKTLAAVRKGSSETTDRKAIQLLRKHRILSMVGWAVGFMEETDRDFLRGLRQLLLYDPDQIQLVQATPHRWTDFGDACAERRVIQTDLAKWDYKHQVLANRHVPPWRVFMWTKLTETCAQLRPRSLWRWLTYPDRSVRAAHRWYYRIGRRVWFHEIWGFLFRDRRAADGPTLREFWGAQPQGEPAPPQLTTLSVADSPKASRATGHQVA